MEPISRMGRGLAAWVGGCLVCASDALGGVQVVPGPMSFVDQRVEAHLNINIGVGDPGAMTDSWDDCQHLPVGEDFPLPTSAGAWTLDRDEKVEDGADFTSGRSLADFNFDYSADGLATTVLARSRSEGETSSTTPGGPGFPEEDAFSDPAILSRTNGRIEMFLTSDAAGDAGLYDVSLTLSISGSDLSAMGNAESAMSFFIRVTPADGSAPIVFEGEFSDDALPPTDPLDPSRFLIQESFGFGGVGIADFGATPFALIELGEGLLAPGPDPGPDEPCPEPIGVTEVGLLTSAEGRTEAPDISQSMAHSLFDTTLSLRFEARLVPEPSSLSLTLLGLGAAALVAIGRKGKKGGQFRVARA